MWNVETDPAKRAAIATLCEKVGKETQIGTPQKPSPHITPDSRAGLIQPFC